MKRSITRTKTKFYFDVQPEIISSRCHGRLRVNEEFGRFFLLFMKARKKKDEMCFVSTVLCLLHFVKDKISIIRIEICLILSHITLIFSIVIEQTGEITSTQRFFF